MPLLVCQKDVEKVSKGGCEVKTQKESSRKGKKRKEIVKWRQKRNQEQNKNTPNKNQGQEEQLEK